jgi:hypothetical protein
VDRERAEHHLRLIAETELRHAIAAPALEFSLAELTAPRRDSAARFTQVAQALITIGAVEREIAETIQFDYNLALTARLSASAQQDRLLSPPSFRRTTWPLQTQARGAQPRGAQARGAQPRGAQPRQRRPAPNRVAPVAMLIPVRFEDVRGELYVMAYSHTPSGARLTVTAWLRGPVFGRPPYPPAIAGTLHRLTATDDKGTPYQLRYRGSGGLVEWSGELYLNPDPPPDISWLEVTAGETVKRIQLDQQSPVPEATLDPAAHSPGEHYLHGVAALILASLPTFATDGHRRGEFRLVLPEHLTNALGDVIEALRLAGALSSRSPVPGQLRALCESIGITDHGITAPVRADLPEPWLSLLTGYHRRRRDSTPPTEGCASLAVTLPELDGVRLSILGLHNGDDGTVIHVHAAGLPADEAFPLLWIRDEDNRWHTTRRSVSSSADNGEISSRLKVIPPLNRGSRIEILAAGSSAEVRASLPLRWK